MGLFSKKKKEVNVNEPVTNPGLKNAIAVFNANKTEANLKPVVASIKQANFLVLMYADSLITTPGENGNTVIEKGSKIRFINISDQQKNIYLPILTDWNEVDIWLKTRENIGGWIMSAKEIFDFVLMQPAYKGIVINPMSERWTMNTEQIATFVKENY